MRNDMVDARIPAQAFTTGIAAGWRRGFARLALAGATLRQLLLALELLGVAAPERM